MKQKAVNKKDDDAETYFSSMQHSNENHYEDVLRYHELSKHSYYSSAPSLGYMDWANQPDPFRRYEGAGIVELARSADRGEENGPSFDSALRYGVAPQEFNHKNISRLYFNSLALSAWKSYQGSKWALRVNPSSGNLHPTESYLISGPGNGLFNQPTLAHYLSESHCLETRANFPLSLWERLRDGFPEDVLFFGLSSIYWREAWKYGERAFRYCHHDIGHAIASVSIAAAELGWEARLIENINQNELQTLLGIQKPSHTEEIEDADCLIAITKKNAPLPDGIKNISEICDEFCDLDWKGTPNLLSADHVHWDGLHEIARITNKKNATQPSSAAAMLTEAMA